MAMRKPGPYAPLSAFYADDEKIMQAGEDAELLYVRMLAYAARTPMTEGWISDAVLQSRLGILPRPAGNGAGIETGTDAGSRAGRLQESGLIERERNGWRIVSWLKWNRSIEEMGRERARDRGRKTSGNDGTDAGTDAGNDAGVPHLFRADRSETDQKHLRARDARDVRAREDRFTDFWNAYPRKIAKGSAQKAWAKAVKDTDPDAIIRALIAQGPLVGAREAQFVPHASTWLNGRRWEDELTTARAHTQGPAQDVFAGVPRPHELRFHDEDDPQ